MNRIQCIHTEKGHYVLIDLSNITDFEAFKLILFCRRFIDNSPRKSFSIMLDLSSSDLSFNTQMTLATIFEKFQSHLKKSCVVGLRNSEIELTYLIRNLNNSVYTHFDNRIEGEEYLYTKQKLTA
jgi:hypothetical protein